MSKQSADIGIRLRPEDKSLKEELEKMAAELGLSLNAYLDSSLEEARQDEREARNLTGRELRPRPARPGSLQTGRGLFFLCPNLCSGMPFWDVF